MLRQLLILLALSTLAPAQTAKPAPVKATAAHYFDSISKDPVQLRAFLRAMPKGGDLHNHVTGAVYAESYIRWAVESGLCVDAASRVLAECDDKLTRPAKDAYTDPALYSSLIDALSMRNHANTFPHRPGHDHFFDTFLKFNALVGSRRGDSLAEIASRAASQNILYLELTSTWDLRVPLGVAAKIYEERAKRVYIKEPALDLNELYAQLMDSGLKSAPKTAFLDNAERRMKEVLKCGTKEADPGCDITLRYTAEALRAFKPTEVFAMLIWAFEQNAADPRFVGINMVQPEDWYVPVHDYDLHMKMVDFLHQKYPKVNITLHAGELTLGIVPPEVLGTHIPKAIDQGHAQRIGHGTDILYYPKPQDLMHEMVTKKVAVEISLSSSDGILGITGARHPLRRYLKAGVPIIICTDDEGVSRSDLTNEYLRAVLEHGLTYAELKRISRNGLEYSFLDAASKQKLLQQWDDAWARFENSAVH
jgi:adenosine deaminase